MPAMRKWQQHWLTGVLLVLSLAAGWTVLRPGPAAGAPPTGSSNYVKYYVVAASYQGQPENLTEIATRFLGTAARAQDIFSLNGGRVQPDGGTLSDPNRLNKGWSLVLPWDAVGSEVQYGLLPSATPKAPGAATPATAAPPAANSSPPASPAPCAGTSRDPNTSDDQWATLRLAPDHAWPYSRGAGVMVAVVDSGVDASLPALTGRISQGTDIVSGSGRGDTDCLGSGTIMASIIAARSDQGGQVSGIAPEATILPVRLATTNRNPDPTDQAAAIQFAVTAGAKVIALGSYVRPTNSVVAAAIAQAASHDAVVVEGAPTGSPPANPAAPASVLRVGGVGIDGAPTDKYAPGTVDVVAPGSLVAGLGISGTGAVAATGSQYAVAFATGQAALIRARYPRLTADQVIRRIEATADRIGSTSPDPQYGWGLIDPGVSVTRVIPDEGRVAPPAAPVPGPGLAPGPRLAAFVIIALVSLAAIILVMLRLRRIIQPSTVAPQQSAAGEESPPAGAVVTRVGAAEQSPSTVDHLPPTTAEPERTGSDDAESARGIPTPDAHRRTPVGLGASTAPTPDLGTRDGGSGDRA